MSAFWHLIRVLRHWLGLGTPLTCGLCGYVIAADPDLADQYERAADHVEFMHPEGSAG